MGPAPVVCSLVRPMEERGAGPLLGMREGLPQGEVSLPLIVAPQTLKFVALAPWPHPHWPALHLRLGGLGTRAGEVHQKEGSG